MLDEEGLRPLSFMREKLILVNDILWCRNDTSKIDPLNFTDHGIEIICTEDFQFGPKGTAIIPTGNIVMKSGEPYVMIIDSVFDHLKLRRKFRVMGAHREHKLEIQFFNDDLEETLIPAGTVIAYAVILNNVTTKFFEVTQKIMERSF